jgi:hypothetical protein
VNAVGRRCGELKGKKENERARDTVMYEMGRTRKSKEKEEVIITTGIL